MAVDRLAFTLRALGEGRRTTGIYHGQDRSPAQVPHPNNAKLDLSSVKIILQIGLEIPPHASRKGIRSVPKMIDRIGGAGGGS